jgi:hypothetical protein
LHGFTSGSLSNKGLYFRDKIQAELGQKLHLPDLNLPTFETLTLSAQIEFVESLLDKETILMGSSLGAFLAVLLAERFPQIVKRLVLLAPAFEFVSRRKLALGSAFLEAWKANKTIPVQHYYYGEERQLHYSILTDGIKYEKEHYTIQQPCLTIHGTLDREVDYTLTTKYLAEKSNVDIHFVNDDHALINTLEYSWSQIKPFLLTKLD